MPEDDSSPPKSPARPKRRFHFKRWLLGFALFFIAALVWLNGPGLRVIGPRVAVHYLKQLGFRGDFKIKGNLVGGLSFSDLTLESDGALASLTVDEVTPEYEWRGLIKGKLKGLTIDGVHADLRLGLEPEKKDQPPLDLKKLAQTIRTVREQVMPLRVDLKNISLAATKDGEPVVTLGKTTLSHAAGSEDLKLQLGSIADGAGHEWQPQESTIHWSPDELTIQQIDPWPGVKVRDLAIELPAGDAPSVDARVLLNDAVFVISTTPGLASARIDLREGKLDVAKTAADFGAHIPAAATLTSLTVDLDGILPDPKKATGAVRLLFDDLSYEDWKSSEVSLDVTLAEAKATVAARAVGLGTHLALEAEAPIVRGETSFSVGDVTGHFNLPDVPALLRELAPRIPALDPDAPVPASALDGKFAITMADNQPKSAEADVTLKPEDRDLATALAIHGNWAPDAPVSGTLALDGLKAAGSYDIAAATYKATLDLDNFTSTRLEHWLALAKVEIGGVATATARWSGSGEIETGKHQGDLALTQATFARPEAPAITAIGGIRYHWPESFETSGMRVRMDEQSVVLEAALDQGILELRHFLWRDGDKELAEGTASLPVPEDFAKWQEMLAKDTRPVAVEIHSRVLSLGLLKPWVPAMEQLDPRSTGQLDIAVSGSYSVPEIDLKLAARDLRSPSQPKLPPADLTLTVAGRDGKLTIAGEAVAPDFAPAVLKANLPFRPAKWAETPELVKQEPLDARVELPRLDVSRFASLVPALSKLGGTLTGNVTVGGTIEKLDLKGALALNGGVVRLKDDSFPAIEGITAAVDLGLEKISLTKLAATIAGGTIRGQGTAAITNGALGNLDFNLRGDHLPLMRNESLILRANANLTLRGPWDRAVLSGTVGTVDSVFYKDIELLPIGRPFTGPAAASLPTIDPPKNQAAAVPEPFRNWGLDVTVKTEEPVLVRGNLATGEVRGNIKIGGTVGSPAPDGSLQIRDLTASLPFSTLKIQRGSAVFTPATGFDPILEIRGNAEPRPYRVDVYVYGPASDPQLVLTSNPPLPENEIMTLLATGTTTSGLEDPQAASSRAMQLLIEELRRGRFLFGKQLRPLLGLLDRVDFSLAEADPYSSESFSTATLSITDRWFISAGVGANGDSRTMAVWRISFR